MSILTAIREVRAGATRTLNVKHEGGNTYSYNPAMDYGFQRFSEACSKLERHKILFSVLTFFGIV